MVLRVSEEGPRGCGYRKTGGIYLVCDGPGHPCEILPMEMHVCSTCDQGIKPSRGWTWINPEELFKHERCATCWSQRSGISLQIDRPKGIQCRFTELLRNNRRDRDRHEDLYETV